MNDRDALLAAITAEPDDDTPRLVCADWLDEHGDADRAEFIRAQCRLHRVSRRSEEGKPLAARAKELHKKLFGHLDRPTFGKLTFRRGFVDSVVAGLPQLHAHAAMLPPHLAPAFGLSIEDEDGDEYELQIEEAAELFANPLLQRCVTLCLPCMGMGPSEYICGSTQLVNLRQFDFPDNEAGPHIEAVDAPTFANLRWANFNNSDSACDCPSIIPLAGSPHLSRLEYFDFGRCEQDDDEARAVAEAAHWTRLRYLNLSGGWFSAEGVAAIFATSHLPALAELDLSRSFQEEGNADAYLKVVVDSPLLARLSKLWLVGNNFTDDEAKTLTAAPPEVKLTQLDLRDNPIGAAGRRALVKRFGKGVCVFDGGGA